MGIAKFLKSGRIIINSNENKIELLGAEAFIYYESLNDSDWGFIYEKFVGQTLEDEGYDVDYNGLNAGFLDRGIDLIAYKNGKANFIQCKYGNKFITKSRIEGILYKASNILKENSERYPKKICFILIVNKKEKAFSKRKSKSFKLNFTDVSKVEYPMLQYFLDHNHIQNKVKLDFREIEMTR